MKNQSLFLSLFERCRSLSWRGIFEDTKQLRKFLLRISLVATWGFSREVGIVCFHFSKQVYQMVKKSGLLFTALYLKQCNTCLMKYYAASTRSVSNSTLSGPFVSLSRSGIPRIILPHHRHIIMMRNERADKLVHLYLSLFGLCRIIKLAKPIGRTTFDSATKPIENMEMVKEVMCDIKETFHHIWPLYIPQLKTFVFKKGFKWMPTWKSVPNDDSQFGEKVEPSIFSAMKYEVAAFALQLRLIHSWEGVFSPSVLFFGGTLLYPLDNRFNTITANRDLDRYEARPGQVFDELGSALSDYVLYPGRMAQALEGAGKRRFFVIGNYFKQRLLHPVHEWAMSILKTLPSDGTFYQERPIHRLWGMSELSSFDLSSATDRWPVVTIHDLIACIFGPTLASSIVNGCLALNTCYIGNVSKSKRNICFVAGQPLGYYGSWALFALTHHWLVWLAANKVNPNRRKPFFKYALLGDDIVIANKEVAREYRKYLDLLQVKISDAKSLVSTSGALEFAKQFWVKKVSKNLSPVSAKAILQSYSVFGIQQLSRKYKLPEKVCLRLSGAGYRTLGRMDTLNLSVKFNRVRALCSKQLIKECGLSIEWWLGRGKPLSPFTRGMIISLLRKSTRLKEIILLPPNRFSGEGERHQVEATLVRNHMELWLKYLAWYVHVQTSPDVTIDEFFNGPVVSTTPYREHEPEVTKVIRSWSLLYRIYDLVKDHTPGWCPYPLTANWPALTE